MLVMDVVVDSLPAPTSRGWTWPSAHDPSYAIPRTLSDSELYTGAHPNDQPEENSKPRLPLCKQSKLATLGAGLSRYLCVLTSVPAPVYGPASSTLHRRVSHQHIDPYLFLHTHSRPRVLCHHHHCPLSASHGPNTRAPCPIPRITPPAGNGTTVTQHRATPWC